MVKSKVKNILSTSWLAQIKNAANGKAGGPLQFHLRPVGTTPQNVRLGVDTWILADIYAPYFDCSPLSVSRQFMDRFYFRWLVIAIDVPKLR